MLKSNAVDKNITTTILVIRIKRFRIKRFRIKNQKTTLGKKKFGGKCEDRGPTLVFKHGGCFNPQTGVVENNLMTLIEQLHFGREVDAAGNTVYKQFHLEAINPNSEKGVHKYNDLFE